MKTLIIHHHDLDGYVAGDIALLEYPGAETLSLGYDRPDAIPGIEVLAGYDLVVIVDYCLPDDRMKWLAERGSAVWIDHHVSAIRRSAEAGYDKMAGLRPGIGDAPQCGAELAWLFFIRKPIPRFLKLVGDYDTFRNSHEPEFNDDVMPFFYASQTHFDQEYLPANYGKQGFALQNMAVFLDEERCARMIRDGRMIRDYVEEYYHRATAESAYVRIIWGYRVLCFNCHGHGSVVVKPGFNPQKHDLMLRYSYNGKKWGYGLFADSQCTPGIDVGAIAQQYGGGGHRCAAGFSTDELLPELR